MKAKASYNDLKRALEERFCGDDYKRTLETKLRGLQYRKNVNINNFIHELRNTIQELYGTKDESAVESLAVNHVIFNLEPGLRNEVRVLQLANPNTKLESILELSEIKEKVDQTKILCVNIVRNLDTDKRTVFS